MSSQQSKFIKLALEEIDNAKILGLSECWVNLKDKDITNLEKDIEEVNRLVGNTIDSYHINHSKGYVKLTW